MTNFFTKIQADDQPFKNSPFEGWTDEQMNAHLAKSTYGDFQFTEAVRPSPTLVPQAGYQLSTYRDREAGINIPVIMAAASREVLFDLFMDLLEQIEGDTVDVVLQTSHDTKRREEYCEDVDTVALRSNLWDFEELLVDDGLTGIAVLNASVPVEVQFDEHKLLIMYGEKEVLRPFQDVLHDAGMYRRDDIQFISGEAHIHCSQEKFAERFKALQLLLSGDCDF